VYENVRWQIAQASCHYHVIAERRVNEVESNPSHADSKTYTDVLLINQQAHHLDDGQSRVGVVELHRSLDD